MRTAIIVVSSLVALGCAEKNSAGTAAPTELTYEGSSTIGENIMPEVTDAFQKATGARFARIGNLGSGAGYKALAEGKTLFAGLSRDLTPEERAQKPYYQIIGYDCLVVFVHEANPVTALTRAQVKGIFTGTIKNWKDVGGKDAPITVYSEFRNGGRATIAEFKHVAMDGAEFGETRELDRPAELPIAVAGDPNGVTYASLAFQVPSARPLNYEGIEPSPKNVSSGAYALSRPLLLVTKTAPTGDAKKFFDFILSPAAQQVVSKRFVAAR